MVLLAKAHDLAKDLGIEARAGRLRVDVLDVAGEAGFLLLQALDALDEALELVCGDG